MSIIFQIPKQARFFQTVNIFTAQFNNPSLGIYDFGIAGNQNQNVISPINTNSIYLIERINVGADIPQDEYQVNIATLPKVVLSFRVEQTRLYPLPLPLVNYIQNQEAVAWAWSDKGGDALQMSLIQGTLNQDAFLVGRQYVRIFLALNIYEITDNNFIQQFKTGSNASAVGFAAPMELRNTIIEGAGVSRL